MSSAWVLHSTALGALSIWLNGERWSGMVSLRTADSLTPSRPARSTLVMRWDLIAEYRASLAATPAGRRVRFACVRSPALQGMRMGLV